MYLPSESARVFVKVQLEIVIVCYPLRTSRKSAPPLAPEILVKIVEVSQNFEFLISTTPVPINSRQAAPPLIERLCMKLQLSITKSLVEI